ncbi:MAG: hypothetical protein V4692_00530, partial [Bdellovibrionota bacterium]
MLAILAGLTVAFFVPIAALSAERFDQYRGKLEASKVSKVEDAITFLDQDLLSNFTFMRKSRSIQGASAEFPRAILFGRDAKFVVSFNGHASLPGNDRLEIIEFEENGARFEFKTIEEISGQLVYNEDQSMCLGCHGMGNMDDMKPTWDIYPVWRGAYGSTNDDLTLVQVSDELNDYVSFLKTAEQHPRYGKLKFDFARSPLFPFAPTSVDGLSFDDRPNLRFSALMHRLQAKRIARQLNDLGATESALRTLLVCEGVVVDQTLQAEIAKRIKAYVMRAYQDEPFADRLARTESLNSTLLAQIQAPFQIAMHDWTLTLEKNANVVFDGGISMNDLLAHEL